MDSWNSNMVRGQTKKNIKMQIEEREITKVISLVLIHLDLLNGTMGKWHDRKLWKAYNDV